MVQSTRVVARRTWERAVVSPDLRRWPNADALLDAALALPKGDRAEYLGRTASDPELAAALKAVLAEDDDDEFLAPAGAWTGALANELQETVEGTSPTLAPGFSIEHYQVVAAIGRGGMGEVYRARDTQLGR